MVTIVTGIWDIKRDELSEGWNRGFNHYLNHLQNLMETNDNMIIFIEEEHKDFVESHRKKENTLIVVRDLSWFKNNGDIYEKIQKIRIQPNWYNQSGWLPESTQAKLDMYNPIVMSKMFLLNDAAILDPFNSTHLVWVDGALTNTVHSGYFWKDNVIQKLEKYFNKFSFVCFPYNGKVEIHGFEYSGICKYAGDEVNMVARGGIFGGPKSSIQDVNNIYYSLLNNTLSEGLMGTEESLFTIMVYKYPETFSYYEIDENGLLGKFFEDLKNDSLESKVITLKNQPAHQPVGIKNDLDVSKVGLYVITFNSPDQFEKLIFSMLEYDRNFIDKTKKFLLNNSTDLTTTPKYVELCEKYGFEHIKKDNIGICGGRQFIAEHFDETDLDFYFFFEDDMGLYSKIGEVCKNGFNRYMTDLYQKSLEIINKENFDFLKLSFTEFYGSNNIQFSWYNVPQHIRTSVWPNNCTLPKQGLSDTAPRTKFDSINVHKGLGYISGQIYLSNWPIIMSKKGNYKCYLETIYQSPFESTLMSHCFQRTINGEINPGILLLSPIEHCRFDHYDGKIRKEV